MIKKTNQVIVYFDFITFSNKFMFLFCFFFVFFYIYIFSFFFSVLFFLLFGNPAEKKRMKTCVSSSKL